jgi:UDP-N-acetylmuramoyl-tripeptide--D-alanyl-D-alanine ligase
MRGWDAERVAAAADASLVRGAPGADGPSRVVIDSREAAPGDLFVGLVGSRLDGGEYAAAALEAGAWGVLVTPERAEALATAGGHGAVLAAAGGHGAVLAADDPRLALAAMGRAWRHELGAQVIAVTGSVGKTSTKELLAAMLAGSRTVFASRANFNTDIGMPIEILAAPPGTEVLVLEAAMRGFGEIATLTEICEPDVGLITNIGPVHLEQVGSLEGVARAKGELLVGMRDGATAVVPADEPLLEPWLRPELSVLRFGPGGDVDVDALDALELPFTAPHHRLNALAAVAAARAVGVSPTGRVDVRFASLRGERIELDRGATVINDCYNASPPSMSAALDDLATQAPSRRRVAVLGDMLELGPDAPALHRVVGEEANRAGVSLLVTVGPLAAAIAETFSGEAHAVPDAAAAVALADELIAPGDVVLIKGSRGVGLEVVTEALTRGAAGSAASPASSSSAERASSPAGPASSSSSAERASSPADPASSPMEPAAPARPSRSGGAR